MFLEYHEETGMDRSSSHNGTPQGMRVLLIVWHSGRDDCKSDFGLQLGGLESLVRCSSLPLLPALIEIAANLPAACGVKIGEVL